MSLCRHHVMHFDLSHSHGPPNIKCDMNIKFMNLNDRLLVHYRRSWVVPTNLDRIHFQYSILENGMI